MLGVGNSMLYTGISRVDGLCYLLRRVEGFRGGVAQLTNASATVEAWKRVRHSSLVSLYDVFVTKAFGDTSLVFVYEYYPLAMTLFEKHLPLEAHSAANAVTPTTMHFVENRAEANVLDLSWDTSVHAQIQPADELTVMALSEQTWVPEPVMWSYISQLLSTLKAIHLVGLAARVYDASNILLTSKNRVRVSCTGIFDVLGLESTKPIQQLQQEDMIHFGQLLLTIACRSLAAVHNLPRSLELVSRRYSADFRRVLIYLLSRPNPLKQLDEVASMCGSRLLYELDAANLYNDYLENELVRELENGRIIRLFSKLGFINERPEFDMDPKWSETGDRYLLKLFRDYVFHQVDQQGKPVIDLVHVLTCLNKLDAGIDEKVMLVSRDERSCLVVSFKELKACVDNAFSDLSRGFSA